MEKLSSRAMHQLVADFRSYFLTERGRAESTIERYVAVLDDFTEFLGDIQGKESISLESVRKDDVLGFLRQYAPGTGEGRQRASWNNRLFALRSFYNYLFKQELLDVNPAKRVDHFTLKGKGQIPLSFDELLDLVEAVETYSPEALKTRNLAIVEVFIHCSCRVGTLTSLTLSQVDFDHNLFWNAHAKGDERLSIRFNDVVAQALEKYLPDRERLLGGQVVPELFVSQLGKGIAVRTVEEMVSTYGKLAGIARPVFPHLLRHSSATELLDLGTDMRVVQEHLHHKSIKTTQIYTHVKSAQRERAVQALGAEYRRRQRQRLRTKTAELSEKLAAQPA